jgi:hydrophobic/amphiphilic exporter-1 (mainly G- bacteria), HAE1 family
LVKSDVLGLQLLQKNREPTVNRKIKIALICVIVLAGLAIGPAGCRIGSAEAPVIQVSANLPGAGPEMMAAAVATPLEQQFSRISGLAGMNSTSVQCKTVITLRFAAGRDFNQANLDINAAIPQAARMLPPNMPTPPSFIKADPAELPVFFLALSSKMLPMWNLDEYASLMAQRISMVAGVGEVVAWGSQKRAVRIQFDPNVLAARRTSIDDVIRTIRAGNVNSPGALDINRKSSPAQA